MYYVIARALGRRGARRVRNTEFIHFTIGSDINEDSHMHSEAQESSVVVNSDEAQLF